MNKKILSNEEVKTLFDEVIEHPLFVLELTEYEKSKLLEIAFDEKDRILKNALIYLSNPSDVSILLESEEIRVGLNPSETLKKIPEELRLRYFLTEVSETAIRLKVLFANLGYDLSFDFLKLRPIEEPQPDIKEIIFDSSVIETLFEFFKNYISVDQHSDLNLLLKGKPISGRINFQHKQNQLADIFYRLHQNKFIQTTIENTKTWLVKYFNWLDDSNNSKPCNKHSLTDSFTPSKTNKRPNENESIAKKIDLLKT